MSESQGSESNLIERFRAGDKDAANQLIGRYFDRVARAARKRLNQRRLQAADSQDIAASVFESLWKKVQRGDLQNSAKTSTDEFWRLLCVMIRFKTEDHVRRDRAGKRGGGRLRSGRSVALLGDPGVPNGVAAGATELTPQELAEFRDQHRLLMQQLGDETLQEIATRRMESHKVSDIAAHFGKSTSWVKRKLIRIRSIWMRALDQRGASERTR